MNTNLNQIKKEYKGTIREIPEKRLKELYDSLYYQAYYSLFIERNDEAYQKALNAIDTLNNETEPWKRFRAAYDAIVQVPLQTLMELHNRRVAENNKFKADLFTVYLTFLKSETELLNELIDYIDEGFDAKRSLEFIREQMVKVSDKTSELLEDRHEILDFTVDYYESKKGLSEAEIEGLELLIEIKEEGG